MRKKIANFLDSVFSHFPIFITIIGALLVMDLIMRAGLWTPLFWAFVGVLIFLEVYFTSIVRIMLQGKKKSSFLNIVAHLSAFIFISMFLFAVLYAQFSSVENYLWSTVEHQKISGFDNAYYFSGATMVSLGYGDIVPYGFFRIISIIQGFIGSFLMVSFFSLGVSQVFVQLKHSMRYEHHEIEESLEVLEKEVIQSKKMKK